MMLLFAGITLPLEDPILKFLLILVIILAAPAAQQAENSLPAGAYHRRCGDRTARPQPGVARQQHHPLRYGGLLYIMFLSGLDMDMSDFRKNGTRSLVFGLGIALCSAPARLADVTSWDFRSTPRSCWPDFFASQTLIAYPIVSKLGIARDKAITIAVGGTVITDTLALPLLTVIVGMVTGNTDDMFWYRLGISVVLCIAFIMPLFPLIGHWFFKYCSDNISQYIFVLVMGLSKCLPGRIWPDWSRSSAPSSRGWPSTASSRAPRP